MVAAMAAVMWSLFELVFEFATRDSTPNHAEEAMIAVFVPCHPTGQSAGYCAR